ncbi:MAG TPA: fatty acyl-AMP ligase [Thermoanaerobaculia bacterium]|nr:fatty acyl-AMP ligase [Thermoanaerobaculia bacterium]
MADNILDYLEQAGRVDPRGAHGGVRFLDRAERDTWFGWGEVRERALAVCGGLRELGIGRGERVALVFPTGIDFFDAFFGTLLAGAVPVPLYPPVRLGRMGEYQRRTARMLEVTRARLVLTDSRVRRILGEAVAAARPGLGCRTVEEVRARPGEAVRTDPSDLGLIQFSSGTTVDPKPVALSHRALVAQTEIIRSFWRDEPGFRHTGVSWLPLYHDMGLIGCILPALALDTAITLLGPELFVARPALWLRAISRWKASVSPAPNFAYGLCLSRVTDEDMEGVDLSGWRHALTGAEAVTPSVARAFCERFARWGFRPEALTPVYGLSEAALAVTFSDLHRPFRSVRVDRDALSREGLVLEVNDGREIVSVGRPVPGLKLEIRDDEGRVLNAGRVGRVWVSGPSLMDGYLDSPEATARALQKGWLDTGDLGFLRGGELYLTGRAKDVVILRGRNHAPDDIERAVDGLPGVRIGCVVAASWLPENSDGESLVLFVETSRQATPGQIEALPRACREAVLGATGLDVDEVVVLEPGTLPRTSSGKLRRREALRLWLAGELAPPDPVTALRLAGTMARSSLAYARMRWGRE